MNDPILAFVLQRIQKRGVIPADTPVLAFDYRRSGFIDSIGIMKFILEIEAEFDIEISDADMEAPTFSTVGGLVELISRKLQKRHPE